MKKPRIANRHVSFTLLGIVAAGALLAAAWSTETRAEQVFKGSSAIAAPNVRMSISVGTSDGGEDSTRSFSFIVPGNGHMQAFETGRRVPIPATTFNTSNTIGTSMVPVTSFTYQHVGLETRISARVMDDGRVAIEGQLADSRLDGSMGEGDGSIARPVISFSQHGVEAVLSEGEPLRTLVFDGIERSFFEIEAEVLD